MILETLQAFFVKPFIEFHFMKRALVGCICLSLGCAPVGVFLILRRMSLMGDALSHAILPGVAIAYVIAGLSLVSMGLGGLISGLIVAIISGLVTRYTSLKEDASLAGFFLISMALGVLLISIKRNATDLMHILFGHALAVDAAALLFIAITTTVTLLILTVIYRVFIIECFDSQYLKNTYSRGNVYDLIFIVAVVLNLVAGFQTLGTLLSVGVMILPALSARFWALRIHMHIFLSVLFAMSVSYVGILLANHFDLAAGPAIILTAGFLYFISLLFGPVGGIVNRLYKQGI